MASTGVPVETGVTQVTDGAAVTVEIAHTDTGVVIAAVVAAVEAGKGAVRVAERAVPAQNTWMNIAEDRATVKSAAAREEAEALIANIRHQSIHPTLWII